MKNVYREIIFRVTHAARRIVHFPRLFFSARPSFSNYNRFFDEHNSAFTLSGHNIFYVFQTKMIRLFRLLLHIIFLLRFVSNFSFVTFLSLSCSLAISLNHLYLVCCQCENRHLFFVYFIYSIHTYYSRNNVVHAWFTSTSTFLEFSLIFLFHVPCVCVCLGSNKDSLKCVILEIHQKSIKIPSNAPSLLHFIILFPLIRMHVSLVCFFFLGKCFELVPVCADRVVLLCIVLAYVRCDVGIVHHEWSSKKNEEATLTLALAATTYI